MNILLKPRITEKTYSLALKQNTYVFDVLGETNKIEIAKLVQSTYDVTPEVVRIAIVKGKTKRSYRKGGKVVSGKRVDVKKAFVRIKDGESLPFFAEIQAEEEKEKKVAEKAAKKAKKDKK
ncbi:50S ribosomal protein L23 [Candidatus Saccharibacteria bacterium RIFCSPHIGHO2_12_FULL_41_12]|nr:MAG: 50S ribosomal protein L23 [Candidatus Saccharibacteria bacterium RIFCSPHIGHO2_12_FULL_41_12]